VSLRLYGYERIAKALSLIFFILILTVGLLAARIYLYSNCGSDGPADAARR
jgi:hypothetical protein